MVRILAFLLCTLFLSSCGPTVIFEKQTTVDIEGWKYDDVVDFNVNIADTIKPYDLFLDISFDKSFGYENLYLFISTDFPSAESTQDSVSFQLSNNKGQWNGDCNANACTTQFILQNSIYFKEVGDYTFGFGQFSREEDLKGIKSIGLKLIESDE